MWIILIACSFNILVLMGTVLYVRAQMRRFNGRLAEFNQHVTRQILEDDPKLVEKILDVQIKLVNDGRFGSMTGGTELALKYAMKLYGVKDYDLK